MKTKFSFSKKSHTSLLLATATLLLLSMQCAAPSARAALETYYDFEDGNFTSDSPGLQPTSILTALGTFTFPAGTGTTVNAVTPITTNTALTIHPFSGFGVFTLGGLTTTGLTDVNLSFALESFRTGSFFTTLNLFYSTDGGATFSATPFSTIVNINNVTTFIGPPLFSFDVSTLTGGAVDGVSGGNLFFEFCFSGSGNNANGNDTFIDNIQVNAVAVPEPSTYIGGLFGVLGLCWFQRRWLVRSLRFRRA